MFAKLRNRFLLLNLVIISVMMLLAFASIYIFTYNNVQRSISMELNRISEFSRKPSPGQEPEKPRPDFNTEPPPERSVSFVIDTDIQLNITLVSSIFDMDEEFYETAKNEAASRNTNTGSLKLDGNYWSYLLKPSAGGYRLVFLDTTSQHGILANLIYTFLAVGSVMLVFIFLISSFFANRAIKPVREAFEKQKQFIADASHELKTPLAVIGTNADVLLSNGDSSINSQSKWLGYIKSEVERMTKLTNDLLFLTQLDYSDAEIIYTNFNLSEAVENVIMAMEAIIFENNISLEYEVEADLAVNGNSEQLKQVVMILLDNAVKYVNTNGKITLTLRRSGNNALLSVTNTGEGIAEDQLVKVFDRFYRTDRVRSRKSGSYGLGLAIARSIIEQHRGKVYAKSTLNENTTFHIELPLVNRQ